MIAVYATTLLVGGVSAVLPILPIEPYLLGVVATTSANPILCGLAAGLGQTAGKTMLFLSARGLLRSRTVARWRVRVTAGPEHHTGPLADPNPGATRASKAALRGRIAGVGRRLLDLLDRPRLSVPLVFLSAVTGVPPLLATSVYAARTRITAPTFTLVCLLGRSLRFAAVAGAPHLFGG